MNFVRHVELVSCFKATYMRKMVVLVRNTAGNLTHVNVVKWNKELTSVN